MNLSAIRPFVQAYKKQYKVLFQQVLFIFLLVFVQMIQAQTFLSKPIKGNVTYPLGGSSDLITLEVAQKLGVEAASTTLETKKFLDL